MLCTCCGKEKALGAEKVALHNERGYTAELCHSCNFWAEKIAWKAAGDPDQVIIGGEHYRIAHWDGPMRGHAGAEFMVVFNDGRIVRTSNLWSQGTIPAHLRAILPDNAHWARKVPSLNKGNFPF